jgi:hypothetical protein
VERSPGGETSGRRSGSERSEARGERSEAREGRREVRGEGKGEIEAAAAGREACARLLGLGRWASSGL